MFTTSLNMLCIHVKTFSHVQRNQFQCNLSIVVCFLLFHHLGPSSIPSPISQSPLFLIRQDHPFYKMYQLHRRVQPERPHLHRETAATKPHHCRPKLSSSAGPSYPEVPLPLASLGLLLKLATLPGFCWNKDPRTSSRDCAVYLAYFPALASCSTNGP